jgi:sterol 14-demethylase
MQFPASPMTMLNATLSSGLAQFESHLPWTPHFTLAAVSSLLMGLLCTLLYAYFFSSGNDANKIRALRGFSVVNAWMFFNKRYDFLRSNFDKTGHDLFSFKVLHVSQYPMHLGIP